MASDLARQVPAARSDLPAPSTLSTDQLPLAQWVPSVRPLPGGQPDRGQASLLRSLNGLRRRQAVARVESHPRSGQEAVDVLCTRRAGDGPFAATAAGLARADAQVKAFEKSDLGDDIRASGTARVLRRAYPTSIVLDEDLIRELQVKGAKRGLGYQTMLKLIVREHLQDY